MVMPEGVSRDSVKPVSILTNRSNSNNSTVSDIGDGKNVSVCKKDEISGRCGLPRHPYYEPVDSNEYVNPQKLIQKLQLVTKLDRERERERERESERDATGERRDLSGSSVNLKTPTTATSVSFTVPEHQGKVIAHRLSISTRPSSTKLTLPATTQTGVSGSETPQTITPIDSSSFAHDADVLRPNVAPGTAATNTANTSGAGSSCQNSVHIPGDFIYFEAKPSVTHGIAGGAAGGAAGGTANGTNNAAEGGISPRMTSVVDNDWASLRSPSATSLDSNDPTTPGVNANGSKKITTKKRISEEEPHVPFTELFQKEDDEKVHILIGATGSVATIKVPMIIDKLYKIYGQGKVSIQLVLTKHAEHFLKGAKINKEVKIWRDEDEWYGFKRMGDPVLHTELRKWADMFLIAPLSANTLAKLANGICDNLLTCLLRAWKSNVPVMLAPAMNTFMYIHPVTKKHLNMLQEDYPYIEIMKPVEKVLVCGDIGMGGMREWNEIVEIITKRLQLILGGTKIEEEEEEEEEDDDDDEDEDNDEDEDDEKNAGEDDDDYEDEDEDEDDDDDDDDDGDGKQDIYDTKNSSAGK